MSIDYSLVGRPFSHPLYSWEPQVYPLLQKLSFTGRDEKLYVGYCDECINNMRELYPVRYSILHTQAFEIRKVIPRILIKAEIIYVVNKEHWLNAIQWATTNLPEIKGKIRIFPTFPSGYEPPKRAKPLITFFEPDVNAEYFHLFAKSNYSFEDFDTEFCYFSNDLLLDSIESASNIYSWSTVQSQLCHTPDIIICMDEEVTNPIIEGWSSKIPFIRPVSDILHRDNFIHEIKQLVNKLQVLNSMDKGSLEFKIMKNMLLNT